MVTEARRGRILYFHEPLAVDACNVSVILIFLLPRVHCILDSSNFELSFWHGPILRQRATFIECERFREPDGPTVLYQAFTSTNPLVARYLFAFGRGVPNNHYENVRNPWLMNWPDTMYLWRIKACPLETGSRSTSPILIELKDLRFNCGRKIKEKDLPKGFGGGGGKRCYDLAGKHWMGFPFWPLCMGVELLYVPGL